MKIILLLLFGLNVKHTDVSPQLQVFQQLQLMIQEDCLDRSQTLPKTFEEIPRLRKMVEENIKTIDYVNSYTIVPGLPIIKVTTGLSRKLEGSRLFAISRVPDSEALYESRLALFVSSNGASLFPVRLLESQVVIILTQLGGFDPIKQPLAFQSVPNGSELPSAGENDRHRQSNSTGAVKVLDTDVKKDITSISQAQPGNQWTTRVHLFWILVVLVSLLGAGGYYLFKKRLR